MSTQLHTKATLLKVMAGWNTIDGITRTAALPRKGQVVNVAFPRPYIPNLAQITLYPGKSTYGKALYAIEFTTI